MFTKQREDLEGRELPDYCTNARDIDLSKINIPSLPSQIKDEIPTLNRMGFVKQEFDSYTQEFIDFASKEGFCVTMEVGCGYGFVVKEILRLGGVVVANDICLEHLHYLLKTTDEKHFDRLHILNEYFPSKAFVGKDLLGGVIMSRMMHFLNGEEIESAFKILSDLIVPGGILAITAVTPYHYGVRDRFLSTYQERAEQGESWPGEIKDHWSVNPDHKEYVGEYLNVFDIPLMEDLLPKFGFDIVRIGFFDYPNDTDSKNKGHIGVIAKKT